MTTQDAKNYLAMREIPQLFESLMTGLMYYRPEDHITYLQECLKKIKEQGIDKIKWNIFIESRKKTPLPPITPENGRPITRDRSFITENPPSLQEKRGSPLPPIGQKYDQDNKNFPDRIELPKCPLVLVMGGPGSGRATQCRQLLERYKGWVHLSMGDLLRQEIFDKGSADQKWDMIGTLVSKGNLAPEDMGIDMVIKALQQNMNAKGIIIEGFPRTMQQVQDYEKYIGRVDLAFVLDCEEYYLQQRLLSRGKQTGRVDDNINAVASRISFFKEKTLPSIKHYDDMGKLCILDGDRDGQEIFYDLATLFDNVFYPGSGGQAGPAGVAPRPPSGGRRGRTSPRPASTKYSRPGSRAEGGSRAGSRPGSRPGSGFTNVPMSISVSVGDSGRKAGMPTCPIIFFMGGPGSGRADQIKKILSKFPNLVHVSMGDLLRKEILTHGSSEEKWTMIKDLISKGSLAPEDVTCDLLTSAIKKAGNDSPNAILLEGYPRTKEQVEQFNTHVGGLDHVILIDCEETTLRKALTARAATSGRIDDNPGAIDKRIQFFKYNSLPILAHFDDSRKLAVINGDRNSDAICPEICSVIEKMLSGGGKQALSMGVPAPVSVNTPDLGRVSGLPNVAVISVVGSPGSGVENCIKQVSDKFSCPFVCPNSCSDIVNCVKSNGSSKVVLVQNFPMTKEHVEDFNCMVGGMRSVIVLDCDENYAKNNGAAANEIDSYKSQTLPVLGYYDDSRRLDVINIQMCSDVTGDLCNRITDILNRPVLGSSPAAMDNLAALTLTVYDTGRQSGLPDTPVVAVIGAPGSGYEAHCKAAAEKHNALHLQDYNVDGILSSLKTNTDCKLFLVEGLPKTKEQLEEFNTKVGGMCGVVVVDTPEEMNKQNGASDDALQQYKCNTLQILAHYDDYRKLQIVKGEEGNVTESLCTAVEELLKKQTL